MHGLHSGGALLLSLLLTVLSGSALVQLSPNVFPNIPRPLLRSLHPTPVGPQLARDPNNDVNEFPVLPQLQRGRLSRLVVLEELVHIFESLVDHLGFSRGVDPVDDAPEVGCFLVVFSGEVDRGLGFLGRSTVFLDEVMESKDDEGPTRGQFGMQSHLGAEARDVSCVPVGPS